MHKKNNTCSTPRPISICKGFVMSHVVGQVLTQAQVGDEQVNEPQPITLNLKLVRFLGRNKRTYAPQR